MKTTQKSRTYHYVASLSILFLLSCNSVPNGVEKVLQLAGDNRNELEKVIAYYQAPEDSLKLRAAYFLIEHMANKYFYPYSKPQQKLMDSLRTIGSKIESKKRTLSFEKYKELRDTLNARARSYWSWLKEHNANIKDEEAVEDVKVIKADMLIENIDESFTAWEQASWSGDYTFEEFCEYVLPYRTAQDMPNPWRKAVREKYDPLIRPYIDNGNFLEAARIVDDSLYFQYNEGFEYFSNTDIKEMDVIKLGSCRQHSSYKIAVMRSLGIPIAEVSALHGTSWVIVPDKNKRFIGWESNITPTTGAPYIDDQRYENYAKVYEYSYTIQPKRFKGVEDKDIPPLFLDMSRKDISEEHNFTSDVEVAPSIDPPQKVGYVFLCVFNRKTKHWEAASWAKMDSDIVQFNGVGLGRIYLPMYYFDGRYYPAAAPFFLDKKETMINLKTDENRLSQQQIHRKAPLNYWENCYSDMMIYDVFEGSNDKDFTDSEELYGITARATYMEEKPTLSDKKFRYVRYRAIRNIIRWDTVFNTRVHVAELGFLGKNGEALTGNIITSPNVDLQNAKNAFDNDIRSNFNQRELCWVGLDLGNPARIEKVRYLFRNSFNSIEPGDTYELFYWDNNWLSLGRKVAVKPYLTYAIPQNAVLWLRNLTKGKEEMIFLIRDGQQVWG